jgi:hypothetical protein
MDKQGRLWTFAIVRGAALRLRLRLAALMAKPRLHDLLRNELATLACIAMRLRPFATIVDVATTQGYNDLFESLQNTPEPRSAKQKSKDEADT